MNSVRVAIVSGANKGIGLAVVRALCKKFDGDVLLTSRDINRGHAAIEQLKAEGLEPKYCQLDVDDIDSIRSLKQYLLKEYGGIDVLVNNAAIAYKNDSTAPVTEQAENTIRINFTALKNMCDELFPLLRAHARVVNLSSSLGMLSMVKSDDIKTLLSSPSLNETELVNMVNEYLTDVRNGKHIEKGWPTTTYATSKVFVSALTFIQQRKMNAERKDDDIIITPVHPGYVDTDMSSHRGPLTPDEGAVSSTFAALLPPNVDSPRGEFIWFDKRIVNWATDAMGR